MDNSQLTIKKGKMCNVKCQISNAFTLPELIIASSVAVVISGLLLVIMVRSTGLFYQQSSKVSQGVSVNDALSNIRQTLRSASLIANQYPETGTPQYTSGAAQVVFKVPSIDIPGNIISGTHDFIVYYLNDKKLYKVILPNDLSSRENKTQVLSNRVEIILFEYLDSNDNTVSPVASDKVKITIGLKELTGGVDQTHIATSEANLRND